MPDAPTPWELQRQLDRLRDDLKAALDRAEHHVTETGLAALLARQDDRIKEVTSDLVEERTMRRADIVAEQDARKEAVHRIQVEMQRMVTTQRWVATAVLLPIALFVANLVFLFSRSS